MTKGHFMRCAAAVLTAFLLCSLACRKASAAIDLTGDWMIEVSIPGFGAPNFQMEIDQVGSSFTISLFSPFPLYTGTIDTDTGAMTFGGMTCPGGPADSFSGTAALDGNSFTSSGTLYTNFLGPCIGAAAQITGARGVCGDGIVASPVEECDDGNTANGDCCSSTCETEPSGSPCSDGMPATCESCDGTGTCQNTGCPSIDLTGAWSFDAFGSEACLEFSQSGTSLTATYCGSGGNAFTGSIDPVTLEFSISQAVGPSCFFGDYCEIQATAAPDGLSWSGIETCHTFSIGLGGCYAFPFPVSATLEHCGDSYTYTASGEQCDDGNNTGGDCCSPACQYEPAGGACDDSTPGTCSQCNATGACTATACPFVLDHYKCYQGTDLDNPIFEKEIVATSDQITTGNVEAQKLKFVCSPTDKNGEGINDPAAHLACYQVEGELLAPRPQVQLSTQFSPTRFELKKPKLLCAPATKTLLP